MESMTMRVQHWLIQGIGTAAMFALATSGAAQGILDHAALDRLLQRYVQDGSVDYRGLATERAVDRERSASGPERVV